MRRIALVLGVLCLLVPRSRAGDGDADAIVQKAIKAHFPKGLDTKNQGLRTKSKGTLHVQGLDLPFTQEVSVQAAKKFKEVMELTVMNMNVTVTTTFDGKNGRITAGDKDVKVTDEILGELKDAAYSMGLMQGLFLKDKTVKLSVIGDVKVKDKAAVGVTVSREGKKDINLYFDKETGLIRKVEMRKRDLMSGQEVTEERFIVEYQTVQDRKIAKKIEVLRDGKELLEAEVLEVQIVPALDDSEFALPKTGCNKE